MIPSPSLLQWLSTFKLDDNKTAIEFNQDAYYNLADGYICARILNQISPLYFTDQWLDGIKPVPPNGSWRLRVSNLKRILQKIHDYASDLQSPQFRPSAISPDVTVIAQNFDPDQINRLIQLILFCAINCDKKQDYIERIRDLPTQIKQDIKEAIEELLVKNQEHSASSPGTDSQPGDPNRSDNQFDVSSTSTTFNVGPSTGRQLTNTSSSSIVTSPNRSQPTTTTRRNSSRNVQQDISNQSYNSDKQNQSTNIGDTLDALRQELQAANAIKDAKAQACFELEMEFKQLQLERDQLANENDKLQSERVMLDASVRRHSNLGTNDSHGARRTIHKNNPDLASSALDVDLTFQQNRHLQNEVNQLKEELIRIESEKEDFRLKSNLLKDDLDRITMRHEDLRNKAEQAKRLQDELDEHKHISGKVISYEQMIENLVKKNNDMKKELKSLEEKNLSHVQNVVKLEKKNQHLITNVNQIEIYRKQLNEAQLKLSEETHRADKAEVELSRLAEKYSSIKRENEKLFEATNQLIINSNVSKKGQQAALAGALGRRMFESVDLGGNSSQAAANATTSGSDSAVDSNKQTADMLESITNSTLELKERIARLEMENQILETKLNSKPENNKNVLAGLFEESTERCKKLESENRQARKRIMLLESNLKDLMFAQTGAAASSTGASELEQNQPQVVFYNQQETTSSDNVLALIKRVEDLQRSLNQKDQELRELESKYRKNIQKAREVMKALHNNGGLVAGGSVVVGGGGGVGANGPHPSCISSASSFNSNSLDECNLLRQQLRAREERLIETEREFYEFKKLKEVHERLILSAFYGLTTPMQWKNAEKRLERTTITSPPNTANLSMNNHFSPTSSHR